MSQHSRRFFGRPAGSLAAVTADVEAGITVGAGQTLDAAGNYAGASISAGGTLVAIADASLSLFGAVTGPSSGQGSLLIGDGATLFLAGLVDATLSVSFAAPASTLELSGLYLSAMAAPVSGLAAGMVVDIVDTAITSAVLTTTPGQPALQLVDDGTVAGTIALAADAAPGLVALAVPDRTDGTRILLGPAMPALASTAAETGLPAQFMWQAAGSGQWADPASWSGGIAAPGSLDSASVVGPDDAVLSVAGDGQAASASFGGIVALGGTLAFTSVAAGQAAQDVLAIGSGCTVEAGAVVVSAGALQVAGETGVLSTTSLAVGSALVLAADGGVVVAGAVTLSGGTIRVDAAGMLTIGGTTAPLAGTICLGTNAAVSGFGSLRAPLVDDGALEASGGDLAVYGAVQGTGSASVAAGATLFVPYGMAVAGGVTLSAGGGGPGGVLELFGSASTCTATIAGVGPDTSIDIASATLSQAAWTPPGPDQGGIGVLDLGSAGSLDMQLAPGLDAAQVSFALAPDGMGGTRITLVPCFRSGTHIATAAGERRVERLRVGDRIVTGSGGCRPVRWIGRRAYDAASVRRQPQLRPVRIPAGSLGGGTPLRDLWLSPRHGVVLEMPGGRCLVPAVALVHGGLADRGNPGEGVAYVHLGLDVHDVILAEGAPVESYRPHAADAESLFDQEEGLRELPGPPCSRELSTGFGLTTAFLARPAASPARIGPPSYNNGRMVGTGGNLERVMRERGGMRVQGWARGATAAGIAMTIRFYAEGIACGVTLANQWRPDLDNAGLGACGFDTVLPGCPGQGRLAAQASLG